MRHSTQFPIDLRMLDRDRAVKLIRKISSMLNALY